MKELICKRRPESSRRDTTVDGFSHTLCCGVAHGKQSIWRLWMKISLQMFVCLCPNLPTECISQYAIGFLLCCFFFPPDECLLRCGQGEMKPCAFANSILASSPNTFQERVNNTQTPQPCPAHSFAGLSVGHASQVDHVLCQKCNERLKSGNTITGYIAGKHVSFQPTYFLL